jgi:Zn-dependent alcohol dehydrogenase
LAVGLSVDDLVAVSYVRTCGHCEWCARAVSQICEAAGTTVIGTASSI